jgi:hypothetical protein
VLPLGKKDERFKQGYFKPKNPKKFMGEYAVFRSSYERKFLLWADSNPNVIEWGSENIVVNYRSPIDNRIHRYFVDNYIVLKEGDKIKKYLIEIKPYKQTLAPVPSKKKKKATVLYENTQWAVNQAKWEAAKKYAKDRGAEFIILTEKELFPS